MGTKYDTTLIRTRHVEEEIAHMKTIRGLSYGDYVNTCKETIIPYAKQGEHISYGELSSNPGYTAGFWRIDLDKEVERLRKVVESTGNVEILDYIHKCSPEKYYLRRVTVSPETV